MGDLFTTDTFSGESACSEIINLNGVTTTNVIPLDDGPSLFFAQRIDDNLNGVIQEHKRFKLLGMVELHRI